MNMGAKPLKNFYNIFNKLWEWEYPTLSFIITNMSRGVKVLLKRGVKVMKSGCMMPFNMGLLLLVLLLFVERSEASSASDNCDVEGVVCSGTFPHDNGAGGPLQLSFIILPL